MKLHNREGNTKSRKNIYLIFRYLVQKYSCRLLFQTFKLFIEEKGAEVKAANETKKEEDIRAIFEHRKNPQLLQKELRKIEQIRNRTVLPGKKWFMQQKPGMY